MKDRKLHIVCLDAPSPPDYGGAIDMYYKIQSLASSGTGIILHYFAYKKDRNADGLEQMCGEVNSYSRKKTISVTTPYIVHSRINKKLISRLNQDDHPIIFEGLHTTGIIDYINNKKRKMVIRLHNNEAIYYEQLANAETRKLKKIYYKTEAGLLRKYQEKLSKTIPVFCISSDDVIAFSNMGYRDVRLLPAFIPSEGLNIKPGVGGYCLYHGNLEVAENIKAVEWLIDNIYSKIDTPFIVAGKNIPGHLTQKAGTPDNISFVSNPSDKQLEELIQLAHVNVLPSFNNTGVKLKLIHALLKGRHCLVNNATLQGTTLGKYCEIANEPAEFISAINYLMKKEFSQQDILLRNSILELYNNKANAEKLNEYLL